MYTPTANREDDPVVLKAFIRDNPFCALVTMTSRGLVATHLPIVLREGGDRFGILQGHVARGNSQWRDFSPDVEAMAVFTGPQHYISANWYPGKQTHGEEVPAWNYVAVHAYGRLRAIDDAHWLVEHVSSLTDQSETISPVPWKVSDAPRSSSRRWRERLLVWSWKSQGLKDAGRPARIAKTTKLSL